MDSTGSKSSAPEVETGARAIDVVVALASHNHQESIARVASAIAEGVHRFEAPIRAHVLIADAGSSDHSVTRASAVFGESASILDVPARAGSNRAGAIRAILQAAQHLRAHGVAVIDGGAQQPEPARVHYLLSPVLFDQADYVSPYYNRQRYEGAITKAIVYPTFRALYGVPIRQPVSTEFACSYRLVQTFLDSDFWEDERAEAGINLWLASTAVSQDARIHEAALGNHIGMFDPPLDLETALAQVVGALFADVEARAPVWQRIRSAPRTVPVSGHISADEPEMSPPPLEPLIEVFRLGYRELRELWTWVLPPATIVELRKSADAPADRFRIDDNLWARIVFDFALGYSQRAMPRDHLLRSLVPLYSGWMASFILQVQNEPHERVEARLQAVAEAFEREKRYLIARWRWPERLRRS